MNKLQKAAWYQLAVIAIVLSTTAAIITILSCKDGKVIVQPDNYGVLGCLGFVGLANIIFRPKKGKVEFDERDASIQKRALLLAYTTFWTVFIFGSMITWAIIGPKGHISVNVLPIMVGGAGILVITVQSIAILVQYGWGVKEKNHE
jgi:hypothetical protein